MGDSFSSLLEEAREKVTHVEPYVVCRRRVNGARRWQQGTSRKPSTAFCILVRLFQLGLHEGHVHVLLRPNEKPVVRCLGYLYLRYVLAPAQLWRWCEAELYEDAGRTSAALVGGAQTTVSAWLRALLAEQKYYGTILPRIPVKIEREIKVKMMLVGESLERAAANAKLETQLVAGAAVRAIYADDNNEPAWYDAVVDAVDTSGPVRKFWVTFPEYGNQELVRLGDVQLVGAVQPPDDVPDDRGGRRHDDDEPDDRRSRRHEDDRSRRRRDADDRADKRRRRDDDDRRSRRRRRDDDDDDHRRTRRRHRDDDDDDRRRRRRRRSPSDVEDGEDEEPQRQPDSGPRTGESLLAGDRMAKVLQQQREAASAGSDYARRPQGYKEALALKIDRYTRRDRQPDSLNSLSRLLRR